MNRDSYAIVLNNAMTEIKKAYPDIKNSFIFTKNGIIITGDQEADEKTTNNVLESFENLKEKTKAIGNLKSIQITGKNGKLMLSNIKDMYLVLVTAKNADKNHIYSITHVILPTILKTMETFDTTHLQPTAPKKLIVDTLSGFFAGDSVQIDTEIITDWTKNNDPHARVKAAIAGEQNLQESINQVQIETFGGNAAVCKVKEINDQTLKGKNMIRIPEKLCKSLEINRGDLVKVKPVL
jgi:predicted regulator of Ras-like GTPase activity (Roadblock/LC7/MglB family)